MDYELINTQSFTLAEPNDNGIVPVSGGGTEQMFRGLMDRLPQELKDKANIICSRVRNIDESRPNILWLHDTWDDPESQHLKDPSSRSRFSKLVFVSDYQFQTYHQNLGVPYDGSVVLRNAIVPIDVQPKPNPDEGIRLIYHTTPHRGLELLVPVFLELVKIHPMLHLDVYSSFALYGWEQRDQPYKKIFDICKNHENITYHGAVPNEEVRQALQNSHIFAYPSIWPETSCIAAIEAMSAQCAIVAPDYAALPETLWNYGYIYRWSEAIPTHMARFANLLNAVIINYKNDIIQKNLELQKQYADARYGWDFRIGEWKQLLSE